MPIKIDSKAFRFLLTILILDGASCICLLIGTSFASLPRNKFQIYVFKYSEPWSSQSRKITVIRHIAVRETTVSRHLGEPIEGSLNTLGPSQHYRTEEFQGGPHIGGVAGAPSNEPPLCRETSFSRAAGVSLSSPRGDIYI